MLYHVLALLDCSPSHSAHHLTRTEFSQFSTTSPAACLCSNYLLFITVSIYLEEIFVYCILAGLENKVRHLWWPNLLNKIRESLITELFTKRVRRHFEVSVVLSNIISCEMPWCKIYFHFLKKHFLSLNRDELYIFRYHWLVSVLFCPLSFYYPIIRMTSLAFFFVNTIPYRHH